LTTSPQEIAQMFHNKYGAEVSQDEKGNWIMKHPESAVEYAIHPGMDMHDVGRMGAKLATEIGPLKLLNIFSKMGKLGKFGKALEKFLDKKIINPSTPTEKILAEGGLETITQAAEASQQGSFDALDVGTTMGATKIMDKAARGLKGIGSGALNEMALVKAVDGDMSALQKRYAKNPESVGVTMEHTDKIYDP